MLLDGKTAIIYGGSGAIGSAIARTFAREGARLFLAARNPDRLRKATEAIDTPSASIATSTLDVLDPEQVTSHAASVAATAGAIDIVINATSFPHDQGTLLDDLSFDTFMQPVDLFLRSLFNTSKAVVPHMGGTRESVLLSFAPPASRMMVPGHAGHTVSCAAIEAFTRCLAADLGPRNIRALCLRPHAISDAPAAGSYTGPLFSPKAAAMGLSVEEWLSGAAQSTLLKRLPTLEDVAETAAFLASGRAKAMTATTANLTCGAVLD